MGKETDRETGQNERDRDRERYEENVGVMSEV